MSVNESGVLLNLWEFCLWNAPKKGRRIGPVDTGDKSADDGTPWLAQNCPTAGAPVTGAINDHSLPATKN
jgi:hypothetical protein